MSRSLATKCQDTILTLYSVFTVYCSLTAVTVNFRSTWNAVFTLPKFPPPFPLPPPFHVSTPTKWANVNAIQLILLIFKGAEMFVIEYRLFDKPSINYIFGSIPCLLKQRLFEPCIFRLEGSSTFRNPGRWKWIRVQYLAVALVSFWTWVPWHFSFFFFFFLFSFFPVFKRGVPPAEQPFIVEDMPQMHRFVYDYYSHYVESLRAQREVRWTVKQIKCKLYWTVILVSMALPPS